MSTSTISKTNNNNNNRREMTIDAADIIRLISSHLMECGLKDTLLSLQKETGIGMAGCLSATHSNFKVWANRGEWGMILDVISTLDMTSSTGRLALGASDYKNIKYSMLLADIHEMTILELAEAGEIRLAYSTLRVVEDDLDKLPAVSASTADDADEEEDDHDDPNDSNNNKKKKKKKKTTTPTPTKTNEYVLSRKRDLEQRLAELVSLRSLKRDNNSSISKSDLLQTIPQDFYGPAGTTTKQQRRDDIGQRLTDLIPVVPTSRLPSLLQQAIKWQAHTGQFPLIRNHFMPEADDEALIIADDDGEQQQQKEEDNNEEGDNNKKRKRQTKKKKKKKIFDLVLGNIDTDEYSLVNVGDVPLEDSIPLDPIPLTKPYTTIKFGKKATAESVLFIPDEATTTTTTTTTYSLVTGSSDGFVEIYDPNNKYSTLRMDLQYQKNDELIGHDDESSIVALATTNDGTMIATGTTSGEVCIWRVSSGKCLRKFQAHTNNTPVACLAFNPDGSHVLTGGTATDAIKCREFGLRTTRVLKEFHGHSSFITSCQYSIIKGGHQVLVITSSADGTVRCYNHKTSEIMRVFRPPSTLSSSTTTKRAAFKGISLVIDHHRSELTSGAGEGDSSAIHTVLTLHTPTDTMIIVPRSSRAFLIDYQGIVIRTFEKDGNDDDVFVAATVSPSNHWLYCVTESGICFVFDVVTGKIEKTLRSFGEETTSRYKDGSGSGGTSKSRPPEITGLIHHPHRGILAAFSNDKGQKKGQLVLWK